MINNPGEGVPIALLHHVHLVSTYNYPTLAHLPLETVAGYLLQAPTITREVAGMTWKFLDAPPDGSVMLVWQPPQLGTYASSDGYVWADAELAYCNEYRGYTVEMYWHKSGYRPPNEPIATHSRRRYRLTPAANPNPSLPPCDSSLWIIHYSATDPANRVPARGISMTAAQIGSWNMRRQLQQHGQLVRKEFMLNDRAHWPTINPPSRNMARYGSQPTGYPGNVISHLNRTQQQRYLQQQRTSRGHTAAPPVKRQRLAQRVVQRAAQRVAPPPPAKASKPIAAATPAQDPPGDEKHEEEDEEAEEEDNSKGDFMDHLTPREISITRFVINHENMEEIFNSPYTTNQIVPVSLGLGRKGEIEALTKDFFDAPVDSTPTVPSDAKPSRVGKLAPGQADDFRIRAALKLSEIETELAEMSRKHDEEIAIIKAGSTIMEEERRLRSAPVTSKFKFDDWMFDGSPRGTTIGDIASTDPHETVGEIATRAEYFLGRKIVVAQNVKCVQKGGLEEKIEHRRKGTDYDMIGTPANTNDRQGQSTSFIQQDPTPVDPIQPIGHTPQPMVDEMDDIVMAETPDIPERKNSDTGSWVMVGEESHSQVSQDPKMPALDSFAELPATSAIMEQSGDNLNTPGDVHPNLTPNPPETHADFNANDFTDTINFSNLDTVGDALAEYGEENADPGLDRHGDMGIDDSAFREAFHATQSSPGPPTDSPAP